MVSMGCRSERVSCLAGIQVGTYRSHPGQEDLGPSGGGEGETEIHENKFRRVSWRRILIAVSTQLSLSSAQTF